MNFSDTRIGRRIDLALSLVLWTCAASLLLMVGCAIFGTGEKAREEVLLPAVASAWVGVRDDLERGIQDGVADGDLNGAAVQVLDQDANALGNGIAAGIDQARAAAPNWVGLEFWANRGVQDRIDDGEATAGTAESRFERIRKFTDALTALEGK